MAGPAALGPGHRHAQPAEAALRTLAEVREVLADALESGGTSFDSLYVNVNGESGYFGRSLSVYGRAGLALPPLRDPDPPRSVHESVRLQLPALPAPAPGPIRSF